RALPKPLISVLARIANLRKHLVARYARLWAPSGSSLVGLMLEESLNLSQESIIVAPPAPAPPLPGAARISCPWCGRGRWQSQVQYGRAPTGLSWHTAYRDRGGSGPRAGAYRVPRLGPGPGGSRLLLARHRGARRGPGGHQAGAVRTPRSRAP